MSGRPTQTVHVSEDEVKIATINGVCRWPRPTLHDHVLSGQSSEHHSKFNSTTKAPQQEDHCMCIPDLITPTEEKVEIIKVYLEARHQMMTDKVPQVQEVRYCLKTLREQMAARKNITNDKHPASGCKAAVPSNRPTVAHSKAVRAEANPQVRDNQDETLNLKETTKRLYAQQKELDKKHHEDRERLQAESSELRRRLDEQTERLQRAEGQSEQRGQQIDELQRLLGGMEMENAHLKEQAAKGEAELLRLKAEKEQAKDNNERFGELEKERAVLKEKIHQLDDMLKSQQRKVRHMIEQLQNSRTVIQERDRVIRDLEEKVAFLEAENIEMHDHMEYLLSGQDPPPMEANENKPQIVYSKPLTPSTQQHNKSLPFIKVIEIKS